MRITDVIRRAGRSLKQAKVRTFLTSLAIAVGTFTVMLALAAGAGMRDFATKALNDQTDQNIVMVGAKQDENYEAYPEYTTEKTNGLNLLTDQDITKISQIDGVEDVAPDYAFYPTYLQIDGAKKYESRVAQYNPGKQYDIVAGSLTKGKNIAGSEIIMPQELVETSGLTPEDVIGKTVNMKIEESANNENTKTSQYTIVAVTKKAESSFGANPSPMLSLDAAKAASQFISGPTSTYYMVNAYIDDVSQAEQIKDAIVAAGNYDAITAETAKKMIFDTVNVMQYAAAGFGALAILAAVFGIINTQYISVLERTKQIGLMKALGARRRDIGRLFRFEAAWIGFLGAVIGLILAIITAFFANPFITDFLELDKGTNLLVVQPLTALLLVVGLVLIAIVAGILPARKAAKLDPIEALRTE